MRNHYERLGVQPDDDRETIWRAYLSAVRSALSAEEPTVELRTLDQAWEVLRDPASRTAYDRALASSAASPEPETSTVLPAAPPTRRAAANTTERAPAVAAPNRYPGEEPAGRTAATGTASPAAAAAPSAPPVDEVAGEEPADPADAAAQTQAAAQAQAAAPPREHARRRRKPIGRRRRWDTPAHLPRRRIAAVLAWLLACAVGGAAAGLGVHMLSDRPVEFSEGSCVTLTETEAFPATCGSLAADGEITAVVAAPEGCQGASGGWVERADGRFACVELLGPD